MQNVKEEKRGPKGEKKVKEEREIMNVKREREKECKLISESCDS